MTSPILNLSEQIHESKFRIAPEKANDTNDLCNTHGIQISIEDDPSHTGPFAVGNKVVIPIHFLEFLWFNSAFIILINLGFEEALRQNTEINFEETSSLRRVWEILNTWELSQNCSWPDGFLLPDSGTEETELIKEAFLTAIAWIIHHELSHHELGHTKVSTTISYLIYKEEEDADATATARILKGARNSEELKKRSLGIICALLTIEELESHIQYRDKTNSTHPNFGNRLMSNINHVWNSAEKECDSICFRLPCVVLCYKRLLRNLHVPTFDENTTYKEALSEILTLRKTR